MEVLGVNEKLAEEPALINTASETDGWILKVKIDQEREMDDLLSESDYRKFVQEAKESH